MFVGGIVSKRDVRAAGPEELGDVGTRRLERGVLDLGTGMIEEYDGRVFSDIGGLFLLDPPHTAHLFVAIAPVQPAPGTSGAVRDVNLPFRASQPHFCLPVPVTVSKTRANHEIPRISLMDDENLCNPQKLR